MTKVDLAANKSKTSVFVAVDQFSIFAEGSEVVRLAGSVSFDLLNSDGQNKFMLSGVSLTDAQLSPAAEEEGVMGASTMVSNLQTDSATPLAPVASQR